MSDEPLLPDETEPPSPGGPPADPSPAPRPQSPRPAHRAYQAEIAASPLGHVFFVLVILCLAGFLEFRVQREWTPLLMAWVWGTAGCAAAILAWKSVGALLAAFSRRGAAFGFVVLTVAMGTGVLLFASWANHRFRSTLPVLDLTRAGEYTLGDATERLLDQVDGTIYAAYLAQGATDAGFREKAIDQLRVYERTSGKVRVQVFDAFREPTATRDWLRKHGVTGTGTSEQQDVIVLAFGARDLEVEAGNFREVKVDPLTWQTQSSLGEQLWRGEQIVSDAIQQLVFESHKAYVTGGHGERDPGVGMRRMLERIRASNVEVEERPLQLAVTPRVPEDCDLLLVLNPKSPFGAMEAEAISQFLDRGGSLIAMVEPVQGRQETGLEGIFRTHGVSPRTNYLVMVPRLAPTPTGQTIVNRAVLSAARESYADHPAVRALRAGTGFGTVFVEACWVQTEEEPPDGVDPQVVVSAVTNPGLAGQRPYAARTDPQRRDFTVPGPDDRVMASIPVVATSSRKLIGAREGADLSRVVVVGDTDVFTDELVAQGIGANLDLLGGLVLWSIRREGLVAVSERTIEDRVVEMTARNSRLVFWYPLGVVFLPLLVGTWVWWTRRR